jgi:D-alanyl-D-alanine carboxypeptidase
VSGRRNKNIRKRRIWRAAILFCAAFLAVLAFSCGYFYRDALFAFGVNGADTAPSGDELPQTDTDTGPVEEPEPPDPPVQNQPSPYPPPPGQVLQIADGNYLLALVTKQTTLGQYAPTDLLQIPGEMIHPQQRQWQYFLRREAVEQLLKMWEDARVQGITLQVISAYRSYEVQGQLFRDYASRHGEEEANTFSAKPGYSEHQLGTAVDFGGTSVDKTPAFGETTPGRWLAENACKYGFVMSYPPDSEAITGYIYEPWHFRYIGVENARRWKQSGKVLCEFLAEQPQYWRE